MQRDTIRELVEAWKSRTGLSTDDLACLVKVHRTRLYRWMDGSSQPETANLDALRRALGLPLSEVARASEEAARRREELSA